MKQWPPKPEGKEATVVLIMEMMARGEYQRGDLESLSKAWGARYWTCGDWTSEAGRRLRALRTDEDILAIIEERLMDIVQDNNPKDRVAAVRLILEERQIIGAGKRDKPEDLSGMSDAHLLELIQRQMRALPGKGNYDRGIEDNASREQGIGAGAEAGDDDWKPPHPANGAG